MNIPTAQEVMAKHFIGPETKKSAPIDAMIEFAQLHVQAALEAANEEAKKFIDENETEEYKPQILNCYPLTNIK